jgi:GDP-4-dehydro-6-deoxy-D-mannose reductase
MNILLTGVNGFMGQKLSIYLLSQGYSVFGFDLTKKTIVKGLKSYISGSVLDDKKILDAVENMDVVIHLAAITSHKEIIDNKFKTLNLNLNGTVNVLNAFNNSSRAKKFIFSSTGKVYGTTNENKIEETYGVHPLNILGKSKYITERVVDFYSRNDKEYCILRIFQAYGLNQSDNFLIPTILNQLNGISKKNLEVTLGDIKAKRDYVHIDDVCNAFLKIVEKDDLLNGVETFNICTGVASSAEDIIIIIEKLKKIQIKIKVNESLFRIDERDIEVGSYQKAKEKLGWSPKVTLYDGLKQIINTL